MTGSKRSKFITAASTSLLSVMALVSSAVATPLTDATSVRVGFTPPNAINNNSYDGPAHNAFAPLAALLNPDILRVASFTGGATGSTLEFTLLSNAAFFDGHHVAGLGDNFGVLSSTNVFTSVLNSTLVSVGATASIEQAAGESLTFALQSPISLFSAIDSANVDNSAHIIGMQVKQDGQVTLSNTALYATSAMTYDLFAGDIVLFFEDLPNFFTNAPFIGNITGDFDYNDFVVVVRQRPKTPVPEPSSLALLGCVGLGAVKRFRNRAKISKA